MRIPSATYRLQFTPSFGFDQADAIVGYLSQLGITDIYASPIFKARKDSQHGYDIVDPNQLNHQLGSRKDFNKLIQNVQTHEMGWLQDIVPNHMAYDSDNDMLMDVLKNGKESHYADFFDIRWDFTFDTFDGKILAPFLGKKYKQALEQSELKIERKEGQAWICYYDKKFPLKANSKNVLDDCHKLDEILSKQSYQLAFWQVTKKRINYRRFFYLDDLIALNMQNEKALDFTHRLIFQLVKEKIFTGLRIDHIDGLIEPADYLHKIQEKTNGCYTVVEKILALDECLCSEWSTQGTTGYDFLNYVNSLFCKSDSEAEFTKLYHNITDNHVFYDDLLRKKKKLIIDNYMAGDLDYLLYLLNKIIENSHQVTLPRLKTVLSEILASFNVYRTYLTSTIQSEKDISYMKAAFAKAKEHLSDYLEEYNILSRILLGPDINKAAEKRKLRSDFISYFQQFSSTVMAKGFEDTFLYNYNRLVSLNEVGSEPDQFGISKKCFHDFNIERFNLFPHALNATATHDTKRGEDVRARLNVLSEKPQLWESKAHHWMRMNQSKKKQIDGEKVPDKNNEYLLYQMLVGAWPFNRNQTESFKERLKNYIIKAIREEKIHSTWIRPNKEYEKAFADFIDEILIHSHENEFLGDFIPFQKKIAHFGIFNSLSQTLIKITSPGVPDFYQGSELWDLNLVDPDNRRPVDYTKRKKILNEIQSRFPKDPVGLINELLSTKEDGRIKLFLIWKVLEFRKQYLGLFQKGYYQPLKVQGPLKKHIIAFARIYENQFIISIVPRFLTKITSFNQLPLGKRIWNNSSILISSEFPSKWKNYITDKSFQADEKIYLADAFADFPVCLLNGSL